MADVNASLRSCLVQPSAIVGDFAAGVNEWSFQDIYYYTLSRNIGITNKKCKFSLYSEGILISIPTNVIKYFQ